MVASRSKAGSQASSRRTRVVSVRKWARRSGKALRAFLSRAAGSKLRISTEASSLPAARAAACTKPRKVTPWLPVQL